MQSGLLRQILNKKAKATRDPAALMLEAKNAPAPLMLEANPASIPPKASPLIF